MRCTIVLFVLLVLLLLTTSISLVQTMPSDCISGFDYHRGESRPSFSSVMGRDSLFPNCFSVKELESYEDSGRTCNAYQSKMVQVKDMDELDELGKYLDIVVSQKFEGQQVTVWMGGRLKDGTWQWNEPNKTMNYKLKNSIERQQCKPEVGKKCCLGLKRGKLRALECTHRYFTLCVYDPKTVVTSTLPYIQAGTISQSIEACQEAVRTNSLTNEHLARLQTSYEILRHLLETYDTRLESRTAGRLAIMSLILSGTGIAVMLYLIRRSCQRSGKTSFAKSNKGNFSHGPVDDDRCAPTAVPSSCCLIC
jgi:hypothetical protein